MTVTSLATMKVAVILLTTVLALGCSAGRIGSLSQSVQKAQELKGNIWAVLVAGSNGYYNYRHQSDVCHAYQVLKSHGVPDERIVVLMYDDIAHSPENPTPGIIVNHPNGSDVYAGVPKDFTGEDVTPENFLKVLAGDSELKKNGKKVLESGEDDHVFIFFSDHGASGLIAFPNSVLEARELNKGLKQMHEANRYKELVIYIEACEAGSMFAGLLPKDIGIFAVTASDASESSYATYWDEKRAAYLGDEFSVNWLEDSDAHPDLSKRTLQQQFEAVKDRTEQSHVTLYGDASLGKLALSEFQGDQVAPKVENRFRRYRHADSVRSEDVPLIVAQKQAAAHPENEHLQAKFQTMLAARAYVNSSRTLIGRKLIEAFGFSEDILYKRSVLTQHECYETLFKSFDENCFDVSTHSYALRSLPLLVNVCETLDRTSEEVFGVESVADFIGRECRQHVREHPFVSIQ